MPTYAIIRSVGFRLAEYFSAALNTSRNNTRIYNRCHNRDYNEVSSETLIQIGALVFEVVNTGNSQTRNNDSQFVTCINKPLCIHYL